MKKLANELKALIAFLIVLSGIIGMIVLASLMADKRINIYQFAGGELAIYTTLWIAVAYINKHWIGEEWQE